MFVSHIVKIFKKKRRFFSPHFNCHALNYKFEHQEFIKPENLHKTDFFPP
jgi:hypothetical protein